MPEHFRKACENAPRGAVGVGEGLDRQPPLPRASSAANLRHFAGEDCIPAFEKLRVSDLVPSEPRQAARIRRPISTSLVAFVRFVR